MASLVLVKYRSHIDGHPVGSVDYQVRYFTCAAEVAIARIREEAPHSYHNERSETIEWRFEEIVTAEDDPKFEDGEEIIGYITQEPK